nr:MAG TPA: hypothetical protein [Caudoviricetes sp.]
MIEFFIVKNLILVSQESIFIMAESRFMNLLI